MEDTASFAEIKAAYRSLAKVCWRAGRRGASAIHRTVGMRQAHQGVFCNLHRQLVEGHSPCQRSALGEVDKEMKAQWKNLNEAGWRDEAGADPKVPAPARTPRARLQVCHVDIVGDEGHDTCILLNEAYVVLSDPEQRSAYNKELDEALQLEDDGYTGEPLSKWMVSLFVFVFVMSYRGRLVS